MANAPISEEQVPLASEDKFLIISIREAKQLCPHLDDAAALADALEVAKPFLGNLIPLFDLRGLPCLYEDVRLFINEVAGSGAHILVDSSTQTDLISDINGLQILTVKGQAYRAKSFDLSEFRGIKDPVYRTDPIDSIANDLLFTVTQDQLEEEEESGKMVIPPSLGHIQKMLTYDVIHQEISNRFGSRLACGISSKAFAESIPLFFAKLQGALKGGDELGWSTVDGDTIAYYLRSALLHAFLRKLYRNSLLIEYVMSGAGDHISFTPYHAKAVHYAECPTNSAVLLGRPAVIAKKTNALFSEEIRAFERLLNSSSTRERHIQRFLEEHPSFLKGLSYSHIYPQLVLERENDGPLEPDFILEPYDDGWCDILDLKLPTQPIVVGRTDRATLAAGIHEVAAQLREYGAYFEQERYRKWVRQRYGLKVYRPRLIALVGRDMRVMADVEIRRAMTAYEQLQIMTFDQLVKHAKSRLLI